VQEGIKTLDLIRDNCTGIAILETSLCYYWPVECYKGMALESLDTRFKAIPSLKEVIVNFFSEQDRGRSVLKKMHSYGWTTKRVVPEKPEAEEDDYCFDDYVGIWDDYSGNESKGYRVPEDQW
jgi:hypothetical protein